MNLPNSWMPARASRGRKDSMPCEHGRFPLVVYAVPGGYVARCLACSTAGPVGETSEAARVGLIGEGDDTR